MRPVRALLGRRAATGDRSPWRCLRSRSMRWWSAANLVSNLGTWMQLTVQNLLVLQLTGSAAATGLSLSVQAAPGLLFGLLGGAVVDRWPRKLTAAVSQALLALVAFTTAALVGLGMLTVPVLMGLAAVTGLIATVDGPATSLLGNDLVPEKDVPSAIALGSVVHSVGRLAGTALAAVGIAAIGTAGAYAVNGLSFLFVTAVIPFLRLHPDAAAAAAAEPRERAADDRGGLAFFFGRRALLALAVIGAVSAVLGRNYQLTLATLVTGPLHGGAGAYGLVSALLAVGGIVGAVVAGRLRRPTVRLVALLAAAGALLQIVAGLSPVLGMLLVMVVPMAIAESVADTATATVLQTDPPPRMRGRVLGVWRSISTGWSLAGPPLLGLLVQGAGERGALVAGGVVIVAVIAAGALARRRSTGRRAAVAAPAAPAAPAAEPAFQTAA
ncbi:MFS transporter [Streptomyces caatingaensis]|uniref:MFS transporter n=1 Tax=Streptomyces caatingaensis TaxID=1678637 RepID=A0A0K9XNL8_9ACTN|nr:MFS transporter [Streptomyces caatingaensis]KNB54297.1 MFS transporter [Streptomyces caatingaensis]